MEIKREGKGKTTAMAWGTWEELVLASAVKRHGPKNWEAVAVEVQTRSVLPATALSCKHKYLDLRRRFSNAADHEWLDDLRTLRVAELRLELQRYDDSILSLESEVKRLEEERERSAEPNGNGPDLDQEKPDAAGEDTSPENRSVNESNSNTDREPAQTGSAKPDPALKPADSYEESAELRDSKESSDVQSSASLSRKRTNGADEIAVKSRPLVALLEAIRNHKASSLFDRPLQTQEDERYKRTVRQHVDLESIENKVEQGSYSSCTLSFYRDLLLLFNNAIVFFPKSSPESLSAHQLRDTVSNEMHKHAHRPDPTPQPTPPPQLKPELERSDSMPAKPKSSAPIIVCRNRSSITAKPSSTASLGLKGEAKSEEKKPSVGPKPSVEEHNEKPVTTGTRTMRRGAKNPAPNKSKKMDGSPEKVGTLRTEKKKAEAEKKKSAADFLKRIKRNSPAESPKSGRVEQKKNNVVNKGKEKAVRQGGGGKQAKEESSPSKRSVGRPPKKAAPVEATPAKRGRGEAAADSASKRPKKRAKR